MSVPIEGIVRPFADVDVTPSPFTKPGQGSTPMIRLQIGYQGQIKTMSFSASATMTTKMGQKHRESPPTNSSAVQKALSQAAGS